MLGTQRGLFFAHVGKNLGLMEVEIQRFDKTYNKGNVKEWNYVEPVISEIADAAS